jgi:hypothetical protein
MRLLLARRTPDCRLYYTVQSWTQVVHPRVKMRGLGFSLCVPKARQQRAVSGQSWTSDRGDHSPFHELFRKAGTNRQHVCELLPAYVGRSKLRPLPNLVRRAIDSRVVLHQVDYANPG